MEEMAVFGLAEPAQDGALETLAAQLNAALADPHSSAFDPTMALDPFSSAFDHLDRLEDLVEGRLSAGLGGAHDA
jgi:hypothetical protein